MEKMHDYIAREELGREQFYTRSTYMLMLVGALESPLGPRREVAKDEFARFGEWAPVATPPGEKGFHLLEATYRNFDGEWTSAILPAWFHNDGDGMDDWEASDGVFTEPRAWMDIPWLPAVWNAAEQHNREDTARFQQQMAARRAERAKRSDAA